MYETSLLLAGVFNSAVAISVGGDQTFAQTKDGGIWAWGWNRNGQLGIASAVTQENTPVALKLVPGKEN